MEKSRSQKAREKLSKNGKIWVHMPEMNRREASGVEFRGRYMTLSEYRKWRQTNALMKKIRRKPDGSSK